MARTTRVEKTASKTTEKAVEETAPVAKEHKPGDALRESLDNLMDEIDKVIAESDVNALEYEQRGGE